MSMFLTVSRPHEHRPRRVTQQPAAEASHIEQPDAQPQPRRSRPFLSLRPARHERRDRDTARSDAPPPSHRPRRPRHPEALPGDYVSPFNGPARGVAIIGCQLHRTEAEQEAEAALLADLADILAPVTPRRTDAIVSPNTSQPPRWSSDEGPSAPPDFPKHGGPQSNEGSDSDNENEPEHDHNTDIVRRPTENQTSAEATVFASAGRGSVGRHEENAGSLATCDVHSAPRHVLDRDYIVVTDAFAAAHPSLPIAAMITQYRQKFSDGDATTPTVDPTRSAHRQRQMEVVHYVGLAEQQYRPLFRRRDSSLVYGRAEYTPSPEIAAA